MEAPVSPGITPRKPTEPIFPHTILSPKDYQYIPEDGPILSELGPDSEEDEFEDRYLRPEELITGPDIDKWQTELNKIAREKAEIEEAIEDAKAKQAAERKERAEEDIKAKITEQRRENIRLLAKLDAIRGSTKPDPDPPSDPNSSEESEDDEEPKDRKERKHRKSAPYQTPPPIYHQPSIKFPEPQRFTGVGKQSVEKWLAHLELYFEASGIKVK